jgi:hypothetical protein
MIEEAMLDINVITFRKKPLYSLHKEHKINE